MDGLVVCGSRNDYQVQIQDALNSEIQLLVAEPDPAVAPDKEMAQLARDVNELFQRRAKELLAAKRAQLRAAGNAEAAERTEVTVFLTGRGLQAGYSYALPRKEVAPVPRKSLLRRVLGPLALGRRTWVMPEHSGGVAAVRAVRWPWAFWAVVALAVVAYFVWFSDGSGGINGRLSP